jgi:hypothetical protein
MPIPTIYENMSPDRYESLVFRVLTNPSSAIWNDWNAGYTGRPGGCPECRAVRESTGDPTAHCPACQEARERLGRALHAFYGQSAVSDLDFSTPEAALATYERQDLPDDLIFWLSMLPLSIVDKRRGDLLKNLGLSSSSES